MRAGRHTGGRGRAGPEAGPARAGRKSRDLGRGGSPESPSLKCAGAWRLPVSPWSGKVSGGAASATRNDGGPRVGAGRPSQPLSRPPEAASPWPLAPWPRRPRAPPVPAPRSAAPRPGRRGLMVGPSPCGRAEPGSRRAARAAGPALGPQPQGPAAPRSRAFPHLPPTSALHPSLSPAVLALQARKKRTKAKKDKAQRK